MPSKEPTIVKNAAGEIEINPHADDLSNEYRTAVSQVKSGVLTQKQRDALLVAIAQKLGLI